MSARHGERGVVLALVLVLVLLLSTAVYTFARRALVDTLVTRNRDAAAEAEAVARGGVRLATAVLLEDLLRDARDEAPAGVGGRRRAPAGDAEEPVPVAGYDTDQDLWARLARQELAVPGGGSLRLEIRDAGARINLNALVDHAGPQGDQQTGGREREDARLYLVDLLRKVIDEVDLPPGEKLWNPEQLADNLLDYMDPDDTSRLGGAEDGTYRRRDPPTTAANRPLLSVDELGTVEGFDATLVDALRPYVTVWPLAGGGVNLNTAPPHVLAATWAGPEAGQKRLLAEQPDTLREILRARQAGSIVCDQTEAAPDRCLTPAQVRLEGTTYPAAEHPVSASVFEVAAEATVRDVTRTVEAVVDRSEPGEPRLLSYRVR